MIALHLNAEVDHSKSDKNQL
jgi:hypothetical protein